MEVLGPERVIGRQATGKILDIVPFAVPLATACEELQHRVVVLHVRTLDIDADIVHPTLAALLHLLYHDALQLTVCQGLPLTETQVVRPIFRHLLHHVVTQLITTLEEVLNETDDALLLVHLRERLAVERLDVGLAEDLTDEVFAEWLESIIPYRSYGTRLFLQARLLTIARKQHQRVLHILRTLAESLFHTSIELQFVAFPLVGIGKPKHGAAIIRLRALIGSQHPLVVVNHG